MTPEASIAAALLRFPSFLRVQLHQLITRTNGILDREVEDFDKDEANGDGDWR